ncbi:MAG: IS1634 family transposase [Gemmatimonadota bacterium]
MYIRAATRKNKDGSPVRYLQLAHNVWDAQAQMSRTKVLYSFGREDEIDRAAVERAVTALTKLLDPAKAAALTGPPGLVFTQARPIGGTYVLDRLWRRLGLDTALRTQLAGCRRDPRVERVLFALVANRALDPCSKLAATDWISSDVHIDELTGVDEQSCYRAMDWLLEVEPALAKETYFQVSDLFNLHLDLIFFDTTTTYAEIDEPDEPVARDAHGRVLDPAPDPDPAAAPATDAVADPAGGPDQDARAAMDGSPGKAAGFRVHGHSKDHRPDLPQVVVGMAVTREGIPVRVWSWPGNATDTNLIAQVKQDLREWSLSRVIWVADRGFTSKSNRKALMRAGGGYILGEKLRSGSPEVQAALARPGRYRTVADNLQVKQVNIGTDDRFVICFNPEQATRDAALRDKLVDHLTTMLDGSDKLTATKRAELRGVISTKPGLNRFLRVTPGGLLRVDTKKITAEQRLDGKYLLRCSDPHLSAEDIALGYKQLLQVERGWRDMKQIIDLRPLYHRKEDRIRAHVILCWLALLLIRIAETTTGQTWNQIRAQLQRIHAATFTGPAGTYRQTSELTKPQRDAFTALDIPTPPRIIELTTSP